MKRTKENWLYGQPFDRTEISGLRFFDGEDLQYQERKRAQQETQKKWLQDQMREKEMKIQQERDDERNYSFQTTQINRMRGVLEDNLEENKKNMNASTREFNKQVEMEKKEKQRQERDAKLQAEADELRHQGVIRQVSPYINPLQ